MALLEFSCAFGCTMNSFGGFLRRNMRSVVARCVRSGQTKRVQHLVGKNAMHEKRMQIGEVARGDLDGLDAPAPPFANRVISGSFRRRIHSGRNNRPCKVVNVLDI